MRQALEIVVENAFHKGHRRIIMFVHDFADSSLVSRFP